MILQGTDTSELISKLKEAGETDLVDTLNTKISLIEDIDKKLESLKNEKIESLKNIYSIINSANTKLRQ